MTDEDEPPPDGLLVVNEKVSELFAFLRSRGWHPDAETLTALVATAAVGAVYSGIERRVFISAARACYDSAVNDKREGFN